MIKKIFLLIISLIIFVNISYAKEQIKTKLLYSQKYRTEYGYDIKNNELYISFVAETARNRSTLYKFEKDKLIKINKTQEEVVAFDTNYEVPEINEHNPILEINSTTSIKVKHAFPNAYDGCCYIHVIKNGKEYKTNNDYVYDSRVFEGYICSDKEREKIYFAGFKKHGDWGIFSYDIKSNKFDLFLPNPKDRGLHSPQRVPGTPYLAYIASNNSSNNEENVFEIWIAEIPEWRQEMPNWEIDIEKEDANSKKYYINGPANIRNEIKGKKIIATIEDNVEIKVLEQIGNWYKIESGTITGWTYKDNIKQINQ